jgi:hypothetical protein
MHSTHQKTTHSTLAQVHQFIQDRIIYSKERSLGLYTPDIPTQDTNDTIITHSIIMCMIQLF